MRLYTCLCLLIFLLCANFFSAVFAQNTIPKSSYNPFIDNPIQYDTAVLPAFKNQPAVILFEKWSWLNNLANNQEATTFEKRTVIKFLTTKGIQEHSTIAIPETQNIQNDYADLPIKNQTVMHRPKYFSIQLLHFKARIIKPNGTIIYINTSENINTTPTYEQESIYFTGANRFAYTYLFALKNIAVNDIVEIDYKFFLNYSLDYNTIFFHGTLPKQTLQAEFYYPTNQYFVFDFKNMATPADTAFVSKFNKNFRVLKWNFYNLPPAFAEQGIKPYLELPHFVYYIHDQMHGLWQNDQLTQFTPYTWSYYARDQIRFESTRNQVANRWASSTENALNQLFSLFKNADTLQGILNANAYLSTQMRYVKFKNHFANTDDRISKFYPFEIQKLLHQYNKYNVFQGVFNRIRTQNPYDNSHITHPAEMLIRPGGFADAYKAKTNIKKDLKNKVLSNLNYTYIYEGLLTRFKVPFYKVSIADKRYNLLNIKECLPISNLNNLYCFKIKDNFFYWIPRNHHHITYFINELPFYLENTTAMYIAQTTHSYNTPQNLLFLNTPLSTKAENYRKTNVLFKINVQQPTQIFTTATAKITLSGQFSTLTRHTYLPTAAIDSSINPLYAYNLYSILPNAHQIQPSKITTEPFFPFKTTVQAEMNVPNFLVLKNDSTYNVSLNNFFKHIIYPNFFADSTRTQPFYPDFLHTDTYTYNFVFSEPIQIPAFKDMPFTIKNDFASYTFNIQQVSDTSMLIISDLEIKNEAIPAQQVAEQVMPIFNKIQQTERRTIEIKTKLTHH